MEQTSKTKDSLRATPGTHKLAFENDRVRVVDVNLKPGGKAEMHSHPDYMAVALGENCKVKFTSADGREEEAEFKTGDTVWRGAESHTVQNIGRTECHVLNIEFK